MCNERLQGQAIRADAEIINGTDFPVKRMKIEICGERTSIKTKETHRI